MMKKKTAHLLPFLVAQRHVLVRAEWEVVADPSHGALLPPENLGRSYTPPPACGSTQTTDLHTAVDKSK